MSDPRQSSNVLIISSDSAVVEAIVKNNNTDQKINARPSLQEALSDSSVFENNSIVIFDIATTENNVNKAIDQAIKLKQSDPTQVLMMVGDKEPLNEILKSSIQPMIFRAFNKPVSPNQLFLSFKSANSRHQELLEKRAAGEDISVIGPLENKSNVDLLAQERKTKPLVYAGIGAVVLAIVAYLFVGGNKDVQQTTVQISEPVQPTEVAVSEEQTNVNSQLNNLNQLASNALLDGRLISPAGNNALEFYDQALAVDPYDSIAYDGRKAVAAALRKSYNGLIADENFDEALSALDKITSIEPLNPDNDQLRTDLENAVKEVTKKEQLANAKNKPAKATASKSVLAKINKAKTASSSALQAEQVLINQIKSSISSNNLIPPRSNNAFDLLSSSLRSKKISRNNSAPLLRSLSSKLLAQANSSFNRNDLDVTNNLISYVNRIDVSNPELATLRGKLNARKIANTNNQSAEEAARELAARRAAEEKSKSQARIIPAKIISRSTPRYPAAAEDNDIEGWVQVKFTVDTNGVPTNIAITGAQPKGYFENEAIKSVKKWRFSPARNQSTGEAVTSDLISTKLNFEL